MANILIIGSEGFIGRSCVKHFLKNNYTVYGCDLVDYTSQSYHYSKISRTNPDYNFLFEDKTYDYCINAAGNGSVPVSIEHPITDFEANCYDVIGLLELIRTKSAECRYIHISSAAVYGNPSSLPINEDSKLSPLSPYGWHKLIAEKICEEYHHLYHLNIAIVRPFSIYGPGLHKQLFWDLYQKCKASPTEFVLWGTGKESRDFIYIEDLVMVLETIMKRSAMKADIYNVANGIELTIEEVALKFIQNFNSSIKLIFNNQQRAGDPINWRADILKIKELGYNLKFDFDEGIKDTVQWLKDLR